VDNPVELLDLIPAKVSPVDARILAEGNAREIRDALAELTDAQRESIRLCYLDGLGVVETSKRMGVSQKMTRKQLDAGINRLRLRLCEGVSRDDSGAAGYRRGIYRDADAGRGTL
jgi:RNA polymerase sigma factor (sigma-70 family)